MLNFPKNFLWGAATSAHQVEGGNRNDWTEWEIKNAKFKVQNAKLRPPTGGWPDFILKNYPNPLQEENYISGRACDHYHRFREDFDIAKRLGHNAHRFSIEWSRIEPEEGKFNEIEIEHYREVIRALRERGMEPFVTLWHWTLPLWVRDIGGWENPKTIEYFVRYGKKVSRSLENVPVRFWITLNEPSIYSGAAYLVGQFPPNVKSWRRANRVLKNLFVAHGKTYDLLHQICGEQIMVGLSHNFHYHMPYHKLNILDWIVKILINYIRNTRQMTLAEGKQDFIGLNYYYLDVIQFVFGGGRFGIADVKNPNRWVSDMGWEIYPEGIYHVLKDLKKYNKPIYITENGLADVKDEKRAKFIEEHLRWVVRAMQEGADVRGYFHWSLMDNFEWDKGFWPRFGLLEINYKTLERKIRPSARFYREIRENTLAALRYNSGQANTSSRNFV